MLRLLAATTALALLSASSLAQELHDARRGARFHPATIVSVTEVRNPILSIANGTIVLKVTISETGKIEELQVCREIASLTPEAVRAVQAWTFEPAKLDGKPVTSRVTVAVTFNPPAEMPANIPLPPLRRPTDQAEAQAQFRPPEVVWAAFPRYPYGAVASGTVVLEVTIGETGKAGDVRVLRDLAPLTSEAIRAVKDWRFISATFNGKPLESKIGLAFVFRLPIHNGW